jgi:hypothetical protein
MTAIRLLVTLAVAAAVAASGEAARAQAPPIAEVPSGLPNPIRDELLKIRVNLLQERPSLRNSAATHNEGCRGVLANSAAARTCTDAQASLNIKVKNHTANVEKFNAEVRAKSAFKASGHGLIGGVGWELAPYSLNAPPSLSADKRALAEERLAEALKRAGVDKQRYSDLKDYNFIIGLAISSSELTDATMRAFRDNLTQGRATPEMQRQYELLRGRTFDTLDCHSNGAMICLAALANGDIMAKQVRLFGPQLPPFALQEWNRLAGSGKKIEGLQIYINDGDPIPPISSIANMFVPTATVTAVSRRMVDVVLMGTGFKDQIDEQAPTAEVRTFHCPATPYVVSMAKCHDVGVYKAFASEPATPRMIQGPETIMAPAPEPHMSPR